MCHEQQSICSKLLEEGFDFENLTQSDLKKIKKITDRSEHIVWFSDLALMQPLYLNQFGRTYFGVTEEDVENDGFQTMIRMLHPDHVLSMQQSIAFFTEHFNSVYKHTYLIRNAKSAWRWIYTETGPVSHLPEGRPKYAITVSYDIEGLVGSSERHGFEPTMADRERYERLTKREREILRLIANEMTSHEIAAKLNIEASTVDTHRKHIIRKLKAKNSIGLVRYALLFTNP